MLSLNLKNDHVFFHDIRLEHLPFVLKWYNKVDDFKYATGIDSPITLEILTRKYAEVAICSSEFFTGIYNTGQHRMIGILKGRLQADDKASVWISSIAIDPEFQGMGYGSASINLLLGHMRDRNMRNAYLAVVEENRQGILFWNKNGFRPMRIMDNHLLLQDKPRNVVIMHKKLR